MQATQVLDSGRIHIETSVDLLYLNKGNDASIEVMTATMTGQGKPLNISMNGAVGVQYVTNFTLPEWR
jgi:hypothetical protein